MTTKTVAIINARAGRAKPVTHFAGSVEVLETKAAGHAIELTREALKAGAERIVAVGGDGTVNEVVNGFFEDEQPVGTNATLSIIPQGTGSDFFKVLDRQLNGETRMVDLMKVCYAAEDGTVRVRYSINVTSFGMGGGVAARVNRSSKPLGGVIAFVTSTLAEAMTFSGRSVRLQLDRSKWIETKIMNVVVGNGQFHGAGMWVCPGALIDDGLLDVTIIRHLTLPRIVRNFPVLYNGSIYSHPEVESYRVRHLTAESGEPVLIEIDGEPLGRLPIEISVLPRAIRVSNG
jgi:YegS/Rv2252/BmrU family lipid kinase